MKILFPRLPRTLETAWRELAPSWNIPISNDEPCHAAMAQQLQCYSAKDLSMPLLRQLGRPGILTLQTDNGQTAFAVLTGLNEQTATLRLGAEMHRVSLGALGLLWHGVFSTYWRPPPGFTTELRDGSSGGLVAQLSRQLAQLEGASVLAQPDSTQTLDNALMARVRAFQKGQGIKPDGYPGPMTFMQIDRALGSHEPSLQAGSP